MRHLLLTLIISTMTFVNNTSAQQQLDPVKLKSYEHQLEDVMEIMDTTLLQAKLKEVELHFSQDPSLINQLRLGIIYHEVALNLAFLSKTEYKGYAKKSFDTLSEVFNPAQVPIELMPFIASYRASALSLMSAETGKLKLLGEAFSLFSEATAQYAHASYLPQFLRGSVSENLPWFFFAKRKWAKKDFQSIIEKQAANPKFANWKIMSFTYWAWANQHQSRKHRTQALEYLDKAIALDPAYHAGRRRSEDLKAKMIK